MPPMAVGVERDVQDVLMGQKRTRRGQGSIPYPVSEYTTDLANLSVSSQFLLPRCCH